MEPVPDFDSLMEKLNSYYLIFISQAAIFVMNEELTIDIDVWSPSSSL